MTTRPRSGGRPASEGCACSVNKTTVLVSGNVYCRLAVVVATHGVASVRLQMRMTTRRVQNGNRRESDVFKMSKYGGGVIGKSCKNVRAFTLIGTTGRVMSGLRRINLNSNNYLKQRARVIYLIVHFRHLLCDDCTTESNVEALFTITAATF